MKKIKFLIITILAILLIPNIVLAAGNISVNTSNLNITKGGSSSFVISASNAAGKVNISSSNSAVATVSVSSIFLDMESTTVRVSAKSVGSAVIKVYVEDGTTYDDENISGRTYNINVTVKEPVVYSSNNTLKDISVDGYQLIKIDNNNYELIVNSDISSIKVNAIAEDAKAKVNGIGDKQLEIGVNNFEVVIVAENGAKNVINLKVTRKDGYYLEDLDSAINKDNDVVILLTENNKITVEHLEIIKKSKKIVTFNYIDENKIVIYSWIINGKELNKSEEFNTKINFTSDNIKDINSASNYADGKFIKFEHSGYLPKATKVKIYVLDKFANDDKVNVYYYDKDKKQLNSFHKDLKVKDGYVTFDIEHCSEYFITRSNIVNAVSEHKKNDIFLIVSIVEFIIIIVLIILFIIKINQKKLANKVIQIENSN